MVDIQTTGILIAAASVVVTAIIMTWQNTFEYLYHEMKRMEQHNTT